MDAVIKQSPLATERSNSVEVSLEVVGETCALLTSMSKMKLSAAQSLIALTCLRKLREIAAATAEISAVGSSLLL